MRIPLAPAGLMVATLPATFAAADERPAAPPNFRFILVDDPPTIPHHRNGGYSGITKG
jgi:hypothetical protein